MALKTGEAAGHAIGPIGIMVLATSVKSMLFVDNAVRVLLLLARLSLVP